MTKEELQKALDQFKSQGGQVKAVKEGKSSIDPYLKYCRCGCNGNYTDHSMRAGESGRF